VKPNLILNMKNIRKVFPGVVALDDICFDLRRGEVHILLGENGAGKSTLIKILSGAYRKTKGQVYFEGQEISIKNPRHAQILGISTIYQELNLVPKLTVAENIFLGREPTIALGVVDSKRMNEMAQDVLSGLGQKIKAQTTICELGVAQQQMVEVAKSLIINSKILIMDEPTSALSDQEINELFAVIKRLKKNGVAVIYISHRLDELYQIGDRVTVIRDGKSIGTFSINDISKTQLIRLMVNRKLKEQYPRVKTAVGEEALRVEGIKKKGVLRDISFSLFQGEILGIAGLLGSGRTELARILFGVDSFDSGNKIIKGRRVQINSPRKAIQSGIGLLTEDRKTQGLVLKLSVRENICLPSIERLTTFGVVNNRKETAWTKKYIHDLKIKTPGMNQKVMFLSGGNQQKVVMGKWLCSHVDILIFDEPTRGIDVGAKVEIYQWMNRLTENGTAIIMISSEIPEILGMSDRILVMHQGRISGKFASSEATQEKILQCALGVANG